MEKRNARRHRQETAAAKTREGPCRAALKQARKDAGMTQQEVADRIGISLRYYQQIEAGDRTGDFEIWDALEDLFEIHQRKLRSVGGQ